MDINYFTKTRILDGSMGQELLSKGLKVNYLFVLLKT